MWISMRVKHNACSFICQFCAVVLFVCVAVFAQAEQIKHDASSIIVNKREIQPTLSKKFGKESPAWIDRDLLSDVANAAKQDWLNWQQTKQSVATKTYHDGLSATIELLNEVGSTNNVELILNVEKILLNREKESYVNSSEIEYIVLRSLNNIDDAFNCLELVEDPKAYFEATKAFSSDDIKEGLPLDGLRRFIRSHTSGLTARLRSFAPEVEKEVVRKRIENLMTAEAQYKDMQTAALKEK